MRKCQNTDRENCDASTPVSMWEAHKRMADEILVVDDEDDIRTLIADILEDEGYRLPHGIQRDAALSAVSERRRSTDPRYLARRQYAGWHGNTGAAYTDYADIPVVMISGHGNIETAVNAIKFGAYDFIEKPFKADRLLLTVKRALETSNYKRKTNSSEDAPAM